jgi:hypothetical protein
MKNEFWHDERIYKISGFHSYAVAGTAPLKCCAVLAGSCFIDFWNSLYVPYSRP